MVLWYYYYHVNLVPFKLEKKDHYNDHYYLFLSHRTFIKCIFFLIIIIINDTLFVFVYIVVFLSKISCPVTLFLFVCLSFSLSVALFYGQFFSVYLFRLNYNFSILKVSPRDPPPNAYLIKKCLFLLFYVQHVIIVIVVIPSSRPASQLGNQV